VARHPPADDHPGEGVGDEVCVGEPDQVATWVRSATHKPVRALGRKDPLDQIGMPFSGRISLCGLALLAPASPSLPARPIRRAT
jgi:hypothetical protein